MLFLERMLSKIVARFFGSAGFLHRFTPNYTDLHRDEATASLHRFFVIPKRDKNMYNKEAKLASDLEGIFVAWKFINF